VEWLTPRLVRIIVGGEDLRGFDAGAFTDHYVKAQFPPPGAAYAAPFDVEEIRGTHPRELWPRTRSYTVRRWDPDRLRLTLDFVVHGDDGVAGPWARRAKPGDTLQLRGPGGAYSPDPEADWHLLVGDPSVLPAIAASLERIPAGRPVRVLVQVADADDEIPLESPGELRVDWIHGGEDSALVEALRAEPWPPGRVHAFVHGEAGAVRLLRRFLIAERSVPAEQLSVSGYWKRARTDEEWRADKPEWNRLVQADVAASAA
jgi:NADPH-dependent ferric siderophore reductase